MILPNRWNEKFGLKFPERYPNNANMYNNQNVVTKTTKMRSREFSNGQGDQGLIPG